MAYTKVIIKFLGILFSIQAIVAKDFEGSITLVKESLYDTSIYVFSARENLVRLDIKNARRENIQCLIIDLTSSKIVAFSDNYKLYTNITVRKDMVKKSNEFKVTATNITKSIEGHKCNQWNVRSESQNTEVTLWIYESDITFYSKVTSLLCSTEDYKNLCEYFIQILPKPGYLPILAEERTLSYELKSKSVITDINPGVVSLKAFQVPSGYKYLRY